MPMVCPDVLRPAVHPVGVVQVTFVPTPAQLFPNNATASSAEDTALPMVTGNDVAPAAREMVIPGNSSSTCHAEVVENSIRCPRAPSVVGIDHVVEVMPPGFFR